MAENKRLVEPLQRAREEVDELRRQLANYDKDKQSLAVCVVIFRKISRDTNSKPNPISKLTLFSQIN